MKNNNRQGLFFIIMSVLSISISSEVMGMNTQVTEQDLKELRSQEISRERFETLKESKLADGSKMGDYWLAVPYEQYKELKDGAVDSFVNIAQQAFDAQNPTSAQSTSRATPSNSTSAQAAPVEKITSVKGFFGSFFKTLLPWNTTHTQPVTLQDEKKKNEITHDPLHATKTEYVIDYPGTLQTIKNKLLHHKTGMTVASYALPATSAIVDNVGHHIEQNPLLYATGGDAIVPQAISSATVPEVMASATSASTIENPILTNLDYNWTDWIDWPGWTGWWMKKGVSAVQNKQKASEIVTGKTNIDENALYQTVRDEHKTKLRAQFKGTDTEFEEFFATYPTPVQGTALYHTKHQASLVDGMVAGLNDLSRYSATQAELLKNPTVRNAHATIRRLNRSYTTPKSFKDTLVILQEVDAACNHSLTPEELLAVDKNPDPYLLHLENLCQDMKLLLKQENLTVGQIKESAHRCKTIFAILGNYQKTDAGKNIAYEIDVFINSMHTLNDTILVESVSKKSDRTSTTMLELMEIIVGQTIEHIKYAEQHRTHILVDTIDLICNHIHGVKNSSLSYDDKSLYKKYITYDNHAYFEKLWNNLFKQNLTNERMIRFLQNKVLSAVPAEQFFVMKVNALQNCSLLGHWMNQSLKELKKNQSVNSAIIDTLLGCSHVVIHNPTNTYWKRLVDELATAVAELEQYEHTPHTDIDIEQLYNAKFTYELSEQLDNESQREQVLQDLIGYYILLLKPLTIMQVDDDTQTKGNSAITQKLQPIASNYLIGLKTAHRDFTDEIPTPPAAPVLKDPTYVSSFKKKKMGLIDRALDTVAERIGDKVEYLAEHAPELADNVTQRLNNADRAAYKAHKKGKLLPVAWVQAALTTPEDAPPIAAPTPPARPMTTATSTTATATSNTTTVAAVDSDSDSDSGDSYDNSPGPSGLPGRLFSDIGMDTIPAPTTTAATTSSATTAISTTSATTSASTTTHASKVKAKLAATAANNPHYDLLPEIQAWRTDHGKEAEERASLVAHPWHGRQETYQNNEYEIAKALKRKINIQNDHKTRTVIHAEQFKYNLNTPAEIVHPKPSYLAQLQDKYIAGTVRLGYAGDILLLSGIAYVLYKAYYGSSFYQIRQLEAVEKQCKVGMRSVVVGKSSFSLPTLPTASLTKLDEKQQATLTHAINQAHDALLEAQSTLQAFAQIPAHVEELEVVKKADLAVSHAITLIKQYKTQITTWKNPIDMILSKSARGCIRFVKMMTA